MDTEVASQTPKRVWLGAFFGVTLLLAGVACWFLWISIYAVEGGIQRTFGHPMDPLTTFFFDHRISVLLLPLPWLAVAVHALIRGRMLAHQLVLFSASLILSIGTLAIVMAVCFSVPWLIRARADVADGIFGSRQRFNAFLSASEITAQRMHYRRKPSQNPTKLDNYDLGEPIPLAEAQASTVQQLFSQDSGAAHLAIQYGNGARRALL